jgi:hypothetical protein
MQTPRRLVLQTIDGFTLDLQSRPQVQNAAHSPKSVPTIDLVMAASILDQTAGETDCESLVVNIGTRFQGGQVLVITLEALNPADESTELVPP